MATLEGLRIAVTGARKGASLGELLQRRGAEVVLAPTLAGDVAAPDEDVLRSIDDLIARPPRWFAASTGMGMGLVVRVADTHGRGQGLRQVLADATVAVRGDKARGGLSRAGCVPDWQSPNELDREVEAWLRGRVATGDRVAVQVHGAGGAAYLRLADTGADLQVLRPYVSAELEDDAAARDLARAIAGGRVDVVTFTSPGAVHGLADVAARAGLAEPVRAALGAAGAVRVAVVGPVTAEAVAEHAWTVAVEPEQHRTGALVRALEAAASRR